MKKLLASFFMLFLVVSLMAQQKPAVVNEKGPRIAFKETEFNFGDIHQGEKAQHVFEFENTGTEPLILSNVMTTCGCTATEWPHEPIAPGKTASITVVFNSAGKMGRQHKVVTIVSNAVNSQEKVVMVGNILPAKTTTGTNGSR